MKAIRLSTSFSAGRIHRLSTTFAVCTQKGDIMKRNFKIQVRKLPVKQRDVTTSFGKTDLMTDRKFCQKVQKLFTISEKLLKQIKTHPYPLQKSSFRRVL